MRWRKGLITTIIHGLFIIQSIGQTEISGSVHDTLGNPLESLNVLLFPQHGTTPVAFTFTDALGTFKLNSSVDSDSIEIMVSSIHYETVKHTLPNKSQVLDFVLRPDVKLLETITVKAKAVELIGDTVSYLVDRFKSNDDKSIADVLRKLPGIEIEDNGRILYQGIPINKFYVEGLDLTEGRYTKISRNLPKETVSVVEIFEHHQPIKILENRVYSSQSAVNLKLKRKVAFTGTTKVATGLSPWLWDMNLTPMLLSRKVQLLTSVQTNNTGVDVKENMEDHASQEESRFPILPPNEIMLFNAGSFERYGAIDKSRYLDNKVVLTNANILIPLKNDIQFRADIAFIDDMQQNAGSMNRWYFLPDDSLHITEYYQRKYKERYWQGDLQFIRNTKRNYLNNKFSFRFDQSSYQDRIVSENDTVTQQIHVPNDRFSNQLNTIFRIGEFLVELKSWIQYENGPQWLAVHPSPFPLVAMEDTLTSQAIQDASLERLFLDHYLGTRFGWKRLTFSLKAGIAVRIQELNSQLRPYNASSENDDDTLLINKIRSEQYQSYVIPSVQYRYKNVRMVMEWPLNLQQLTFRDPVFDSVISKNRLLQAPQYTLFYTFGGFWEFKLSWQYFQRMSDPDDFNYAWILKNYQELMKTEALIRETDQQMAGIYVSYRNAITAFFNTLSYHYITRHSNLLYSGELQNDGSMIMKAIPLPNITHSHIVRLRMSKYLQLLHSSISINATWSTYRGVAAVNNSLFNTTTSDYSISPEVYFQAGPRLNLNYKFKANLVNSIINSELRNQTSINRHYLTVNMFPVTNQTFSVNMEYYVYNHTHYNFIDLMYRYTIEKHKIDLEIKWNNLLNNATFIEQQYSQYVVTEYERVLRPSQVLVGVRMGF